MSTVGSPDAALRDWGYPGEPACGVIEAGIDDGIMSRIDAFASDVRACLPAGYLHDCLNATVAWERHLRAQGVTVERLGGEGDEDPDATDARHIRIPLDKRSGYRVADGTVHQHWWLGVGPSHWLFDPTGQARFDRLGGVHLDRYLIDGDPFIEHRQGDALR